MSLFEWIGEGFNPGPVGTLGPRDPEDEPHSPAAVIAGFIVTASLLVGGILYAYYWWGAEHPEWVLALAGGLLFYMLVGYCIRPRPDTSNIGWLGGLFDNPFRISDDINRLLIFLAVVLWPGGFMARSIVNMVRLVFSL
jgi:hypothetical protein